MRALRDGARTQGDRKGSPLLETAWQADPPVYSRGWACPRPAALPPPCRVALVLSFASSVLYGRPPSPSRITGDDDAHDPCDCDHPYRTARSPVNTPVHQDARNRSGAKPPAARGCPLACSISQEEA